MSAPGPAKPLDAGSPVTTSWYMIAIARPPGASLTGGLVRRRRREQEVARPNPIASRGECRSPFGVGLIRHNQVDTALLEHRGRRIHDAVGVARTREAVDDRTDPQVAEVLVVAHLGIEQHSPTKVTDTDSYEPVAPRRIENVEGFGVARAH